jgi:predicted small lipoprotein YifL
MVRLFSLGLAVAAVASLAACGGNGRRSTAARMPPATLTQIGVNSYLWRAALDTVSFAPIAQTDSAGGVIVTEWYVNPADPSDRVKVSVSILDATLRADALRVTAARQRLQNGQWVDAPVAAATVQRLEDIILTRARDLRRGARAG